MLRLTIPDGEMFDDTRQEFVKLLGGVLSLEHSLASIAAWEAEFQKPFFGKDAKTVEETLGYIRCMDLSTETDPSLYRRIGAAEMEKIQRYISDKRTATWFSKEPSSNAPSRETVTSELVYYWMIALNIPFECQYWHFNRLQTLIRICIIKQEKPKPMSKRALASRNAALNAARRARLGSKG